ncbi:junctional sarcoplasmic reticulum protein 1 [Aquarana catesbeiana]|uniref:junctional sarcoplasmic reticulum protein 1 n=1 Tax=Aquarana catesbeiana TaxID=8400 RepID=UPI003CC9385F
MKQKPEPKSVGPLKDEDFVPWNGVTLNRCLAIAAIAALLSVGFQILQESVDSDDLAEPENDIWTSPESNDQQSEPWFFENWFGSSTPNLPVIEEPEIPETTEPDNSEVKELEEPIAEESELTDEEIETKTEALLEEPIETEKQEEKMEKPKPSEQWGLKSKGRYMEAKAIKIRRAENGSQSNEVFPFKLAKKPKDSAKPFSEGREKPPKDTKYQKKYDEKKYDSPKKQDHEKSFKKEREEHNKYFKQDKGKKEDKEYKTHKQYHYEKDYKKKYDLRHHG